MLSTTDTERQRQVIYEEAFKIFKRQLFSNSLFFSSKSFFKKMCGTSAENKYYYNELKNKLLSYIDAENQYLKINSFLKITSEYFKTKFLVAKISLNNEILCLTLYPGRHNSENISCCSSLESIEPSPITLEIESEDILKKAKVFIEILMLGWGLVVNREWLNIDYSNFFDNSLIKFSSFAKLVPKKADIFDINGNKIGYTGYEYLNNFDRQDRKLRKKHHIIYKNDGSIWFFICKNKKCEYYIKDDKNSQIVGFIDKNKYLITLDNEYIATIKKKKFGFFPF